MRPVVGLLAVALVAIAFVASSASTVIPLTAKDIARTDASIEINDGLARGKRHARCRGKTKTTYLQLNTPLGGVEITKSFSRGHDRESLLRRLLPPRYENRPNYSRSRSFHRDVRLLHSSLSIGGSRSYDYDLDC